MVSVIKFEQISHMVVMFRLLTLNKVNAGWVRTADLKTVAALLIFVKGISKSIIFAYGNSFCLNALTESIDLNKMTYKF